MQKELLGFVLASGARKQILKLLAQGPARPMEIARKLPYDQPYTTRILQALEKNRLVECLTPKKKGWRVYAATALGKKIAKVLPST